MSKDQEPENSKDIYGVADLPQMSWHDCRVFALMVDARRLQFSLDLDYIVKWEESKESRTYDWWIAPATLAFSDVLSLKIDVDSYDMNLDIDVITMSDLSPEHHAVVAPHYRGSTWIVELQQGEIEFAATSFDLFLREAPKRMKACARELSERGGISFRAEGFRGSRRT